MPRSPTQPEPPEFFVDRSLGRHLLPDALQQAGYTAHTLASVYGEDAIRRRPVEVAAVEERSVKMFCLTNANLRGEEQRERVLTNIHRIIQRSRKAGPWICGVSENRVAQIWPPRLDRERHGR